MSRVDAPAITIMCVWVCDPHFDSGWSGVMVEMVSLHVMVKSPEQPPHSRFEATPLLSTPLVFQASFPCVRASEDQLSYLLWASFRVGPEGPQAAEDFTFCLGRWLESALESGLFFEAHTAPGPGFLGEGTALHAVWPLRFQDWCKCGDILIYTQNMPSHWFLSHWEPSCRVSDINCCLREDQHGTLV